MWMRKSIRDCWRGYKCRIKRDHYKPYDTDPGRRDNKPDHIPLEDFEVLLRYWADDDVKKKAKTNSESRKQYQDTHTAGPKSFAQLHKKLDKKSDATLFVKTRKRTAGRVYKSDHEIMKKRIESIEKALGASGENGGRVEEVLLNGKSHGASWLIGRHAKPSRGSINASTDTYVQELTTKIRQNLVDEVEDKVNKKVQDEVNVKVNQKLKENLAWMLKKLGEANLDMNINLADLCATISTDNENGTPVTGSGCS